MATSADIGYGVAVTFTPFTDAAGTLGPTVITIGEITDVAGPSMSKEAVEATHTTSPSNYDADGPLGADAQAAIVGWSEYIDGMLDAGELSLDVNLNPDTIPTVVYSKGRLDLTWPPPEVGEDPAWFRCDAVCTSYDETIPVKGKMTAKIAFKLSGVPSFGVAGTTPPA